MSNIKSKIVLITGCSSGFGYVTAKYLISQGYTVIPTVRKNSDLKLFPKTVLLDVTWPSEKIDAVVSAVIKQYQRIDVLINNAGYGLLGPIADINEDQAKAQFETNFFGSLKMIKSVLPAMKEQKSGLIINISSVLGLFSIPEYGVYSASKYALESLSAALRLEESKNGIKVVVVNPGSFNTKFYDNAQTTGEKFSSADYALTPDPLGKLIEKIIETKRPKQNYLVGHEARAVKLLLSLPPFLKYLLLQKYFS